MGNCCCPEKKQPGHVLGGGPQSDSEQFASRDRAAQDRAADAAAARQQNFEKSPVGKAAYKAVAEAKKQSDTELDQQANKAADWLS
ncbi:hypothetical protein BSKO_05290 [Bryopsis sp. KO-2023]|nr:hypothetical protein BSKO_05290 [Bryopsis sp. KO-2023]